MDQLENIQEPILLNDWATTLSDGTYCRIEENSLSDIHFRGIVHVEPRVNPCKFCPYKKGADITIITSSVHDAEPSGVFTTKDGVSYRLGDPHPTYKKLFGFGEISLTARLVDIIKRKRLL
jgi:hypothetical protein